MSMKHILEILEIYWLIRASYSECDGKLAQQKSCDTKHEKSIKHITSFERR